MITKSRIGVREQDTLFCQIFLQTAVNDFRLVLSLHSGQVLLFSLRDTESVVGFANVVGHVVPVAALFLRRFHVIENFVEIEIRHVAAPARHRS